LYYSNKVVWTKQVQNPNGCRIYYGDGNILSNLEFFPTNLIEAVSFLADYCESISAMCRLSLFCTNYQNISHMLSVKYGVLKLTVVYGAMEVMTVTVRCQFLD